MALAMAVFAFVGTGSLVVAYGAVALAGLFTPPLEGGLRALWSSVLPKEVVVTGGLAVNDLGYLGALFLAAAADGVLL